MISIGLADVDDAMRHGPFAPHVVFRWAPKRADWIVWRMDGQGRWTSDHGPEPFENAFGRPVVFRGRFDPENLSDKFYLGRPVNLDGSVVGCAIDQQGAWSAADEYVFANYRDVLFDTEGGCLRDLDRYNLGVTLQVDASISDMRWQKLLSRTGAWVGGGGWRVLIDELSLERAAATAA
jgi:hypothetical protein